MANEKVEEYLFFSSSLYLRPQWKIYSNIGEQVARTGI